MNSKLPGIRAITFDVGGTLIDPWPSVGHVYARVAADFGWRRADPALLNRQFAAAWKTKGAFDYSRRAWGELASKTFFGVCDQTDRFFDALYDRFAQPDAWRVYPDALPALAALQARGFQLGVISNWDERLRPLLCNLGLDRFFGQLAISREIGAAKPDPRIFWAAAEAWQLPAAEILHVGDSRREDFDGARMAGMRALLLDRSGRGAGAGAIRSLGEIGRAEDEIN